MTLPPGKGCLEDDSFRPSQFLQLAENEALNTAKFLRGNCSTLEKRTSKAAVDDALKLCDTIAVLSAAGRKCDAEHAIEIMQKVESFLDVLSIDLDCMLAKTK